MEKSLFSIRMHASAAGEHISGAERVCSRDELAGLLEPLLRRALEHEKGAPENIRFSIDLVSPEKVTYASLPPLKTCRVTDFHEGRRAALALLEAVGVSAAAACTAMETLARGAAPGGKSMRGAMLVDACSGERLEKDFSRGVRVTRMDLTPVARRELSEALQKHDLNNPHVCEALVLAAKVIAAPGMVAELCWSDDPGYTAGYVASPPYGYVRFPHLKPAGEHRGGRAFFVRRDGFDLVALTEYLERTVVIFDRIGSVEE